MLRRKFKKADAHPNNGSFTYSKVESSMEPDSLRDNQLDESAVLASSLDVDVDADEKASSSWSSGDKKVFEDQLESLQDQLIATMMENQKLGLYFFYLNSHLSKFFFSYLRTSS